VNIIRAALNSSATQQSNSYCPADAMIEPFITPFLMPILLKKFPSTVVDHFCVEMAFDLM